MKHKLAQENLDQIRLVLRNAHADDWGLVSDFYPDEAAESKREAFDEAAVEWENAWADALQALPAIVADGGLVDLAPLADAIESARGTESDWGDDPATREICRSLAAAIDWKINRPGELLEMIRNRQQTSPGRRSTQMQISEAEIVIVERIRSVPRLMEILASASSAGLREGGFDHYPIAYA